MDNLEKQNQYAILMSKLKRATKYENYYEAIFIEYAILEDRSASILKHAKIRLPKDNKNGTNLFHKLEAIENNSKFNNAYCQKHLPKEYIEKIQKWREKRNTLIHDLVETKYDSKLVKQLALDGECYVMKFSSKSKLINNYFDKL